MSTRMLIVGGTSAALLGAPAPDPDPESDAKLAASGYFPPVDIITTVDYPGSVWPVSGWDTPTFGQSIEIGADMVEAAVRAADGLIVAVGISQGALVLDTVQARLADDPTAPPADQVSFFHLASPNRMTGLTALLPQGAHLPIFEWTVQHPVDSQYDTVVITGEYDGGCRFPTKLGGLTPDDLVPVLNAALGFIEVHVPNAWVPRSEVPAENITETVNARGATLTTYLMPTNPLPLVTFFTDVLRTAGVWGWIVDHVAGALNNFLRPQVEAGYRDA